MLAAVAALTTACAAILHIGTGSKTWAALVVFASAVSIAAVFSALLYLHGTLPELREMTMTASSEPNTGVRAVFHRIFGTDSPATQHATAEVDISGMVASITGTGTAITAVTALARRFGTTGTPGHTAARPEARQTASV